jgi:hypothetical protein
MTGGGIGHASHPSLLGAGGMSGSRGSRSSIVAGGSAVPDYWRTDIGNGGSGVGIGRVTAAGKTKHQGTGKRSLHGSNKSKGSDDPSIKVAKAVMGVGTRKQHWPNLHALVQCAVRCSALKCGAVQCSAVQCSAVQCSAMQCSTVPCRAVQCNAVQCSVV